MPLGFTDIDHAVVRVDDADAAAGLYRRFGFTIAPRRQRRSGQAAPSVAARHILFQPFPGRSDVANFVVLQSITDQYGMPDSLAQILSFMFDAFGPRAIVGYTPDVAASMQAMHDCGIATNSPTWLSEPGWHDEDADREVPVRIQQLAALTRRMPFVVNGFHSSTLDSFRYAPWTAHPNSARYLAGVTGVSADLDADVDIMARVVFGVEPRWDGPDIAVLSPREIFLRVVSPRGFGRLYSDLDFSTERALPALCALTFAVASTTVVRRCLDDHAVAHLATPDGRVLIARQDAANTILEFTAAPGGNQP